MSARVGLLGVATSHAQHFAEILVDEGHRVAAVCDPGRPDRVAALLRQRPGAAAVDDLQELASRCDVVLLLDPDWDLRLEQALALVAHGAGVLVDKPLAGSLDGLELLERAATGAAGRIAGGSALRFPPHPWRRLSPGAARVTCAGHPFYYGVHATSLAVATSGPAVSWAEAVPGDGLRGTLGYADGATVAIEVHPTGPAPFEVTVEGTNGSRALTLDGADCYRRMLVESMAVLLGEVPGDVESLLAPERALLALLWSAEQGGRRVDPAAVPGSFAPFSGAAFAEAYRPPPLD